jgi:hypothetical protein
MNMDLKVILEKLRTIYDNPYSDEELGKLIVQIEQQTNQKVKKLDPRRPMMATSLSDEGTFYPAIDQGTAGGLFYTTAISFDTAEQARLHAIALIMHYLASCEHQLGLMNMKPL